MRLWSIHPKYLDSKGLVAVWREGLLAQSVLIQGEYKICPNYIEKKYCEKTILRNKFYAISHTTKCPKCKGTGKIKTSWYNHPQLERFKKLGNIMNTEGSIRTIGYYLNIIWHEANNRGYKFNFNKIKVTYSCPEFITVTTGQLEYEFKILQRRLYKRNYKTYRNNNAFIRTEHYYQPHPLFILIKGDIESWERIK